MSPLSTRSPCTWAWKVEKGVTPVQRPQHEYHHLLQPALDHPYEALNPCTPRLSLPPGLVSQAWDLLGQRGPTLVLMPCLKRHLEILQNFLARTCIFILHRTLHVW